MRSGLPSRRLLLQALGLLACIVLLGACSGGEPPSTGLRILLTNDDGFETPGIQTLKTALEADGHDVTLVAPLTNRSVSSAAITVDAISYRKVEEKVWAVDATPATCVIIALTAILGEEPDLIVSGTNDRANLGVAPTYSGTVGATIAGLTAKVPGIAFSTDPPVKEGDEPAYTRHFENVAEFAVRLIAKLRTHVDGALPDHVSLNVNYPPLPPERIQGVMVGVQGRVSDESLEFVEVETAPGVKSFLPHPIHVEEDEKDVRGSDIVAFAEGYITVVPLEADYSAGMMERLRVRRSLGGLDP